MLRFFAIARSISLLSRTSLIECWHGAVLMLAMSLSWLSRIVEIFGAGYRLYRCVLLTMIKCGQNEANGGENVWSEAVDCFMGYY